MKACACPAGASCRLLGFEPKLIWCPVCKFHGEQPNGFCEECVIDRIERKLGRALSHAEQEWQIKHFDRQAKQRKVSKLVGAIGRGSRAK